ncbi:MAG TPA: hypothetical protein VGW34_14280 [Allosphingosinicella sp.]|nr:hypothetical protein [Allosphingosinicella sp.]
MRTLATALAAALIAAPLPAMKPPRERSPAPRDVLAQAGLGNSDEELARAAAAAAAHPLGTVGNPVRVGGPEGERSYLARLRCADGSAPRIGPKRPAGVAAFGSLADLYPLDCGAAPPGRLDLVMDMYHAEHVEQRAPDGFTLEPPR